MLDLITKGKNLCSGSLTWVAVLHTHLTFTAPLPACWICQGVKRLCRASSLQHHTYIELLAVSVKQRGRESGFNVYIKCGNSSTVLMRLILRGEKTDYTFSFNVILVWCYISHKYSKITSCSTIKCQLDQTSELSLLSSLESEPVFDPRWLSGRLMSDFSPNETRHCLLSTSPSGGRNLLMLCLLALSSATGFSKPHPHW